MPVFDITGYTPYRKSAVQYMRPYELGESMEGISVTAGVTPEVGGMIGININDGTDKWYITKEFVKANYERVEDDYGPEDS